MRKFLSCLLLIFIGLSCTKEQQTLCACSPVEAPSFSLIIKNEQNADLLDPQGPSSFRHEKIKLKYKLGEDLMTLNFAFRPPFFYGTGAATKFPFYQIYSSEMVSLKIRNIASEFYVDLGTGDIDTLSFDIDPRTKFPSNVKINSQASVNEESLPSLYQPVFYLLK